MNNPRARGQEACQCSAERWARRDFLRTLGAGTGLLAANPWSAMAGPFTRPDFEKLVPADKRLRPEWVKSLTERGTRTVYRGKELETIGMPVGGLFAGQVYLGGDGTLWHWDIFNKRVGTGSEHYAKPVQPVSPFEQGFELRLTSAGNTQARPLNREHWRDITFCGEYPIAFVEYREPALPVTVGLEAFSPFIPLNTEDSSLPATILEYTLTNTGNAEVEIELRGRLQNPVCLYSSTMRDGMRRNRILKREGLLFLECSAAEVPTEPASKRPDILFDDFERGTYGKWAATGTAFGSGPIELTKVPAYQGDLKAKGRRAVNSHTSAPGGSVEEKDSARGKLTSAPFSIERNYITFLMGGGAHRGKTCMNLVVEGQTVRTATGLNNNAMRPVSWDVRRWAGKTATLEIVDDEPGPWGNIGVDDIVFSDQPAVAAAALADEGDFGTMGLALLGARQQDVGLAGEASRDVSQSATARFDETLVGYLSRRLTLPPGAADKVTFVICWHFPNLKLDRLPRGRHYGNRFASALEVAEYVQKNFPRLAEQTRLWHETWYDSTLPYWFLDRTFLNTSILASSTCYRLGNGRFYGWEGVGCCEGTCGHVWQYAHALAHLFPELERATREQVDFGLALQPDGAIHFRGEFNDIPAIDAQAGTILRALREHRTSSDDSFLKRNWPRIKRATKWLIAKDNNGDGLIESNQHNTLDTDWFGPVAWLSGLYLAALSAAEAMANELGDADFAEKCRTILRTGQKNIVERLFDEDYFINKPDPQHLDAINSGSGCHIDQVFGQSWAFQVGLPRVLPKSETVKALKSLWTYNFTPDVGPYREAYKAGRWYAMPGEAGLLMCTFPRSDWDYAQAKGKGPEWAAGYFNECMNGFEYQVAGHMLWEGMVMEGLAVTRAVHDRYHALRRNPWNEIECGDHYARSMASYGVFLAACGFEHHAQRGMLGFAPRLTPENIKVPFTTAEGWGSFGQSAEGNSLKAHLQVKWGSLRLQTLRLAIPGNMKANAVEARANGQKVEVTHSQTGDQVALTFPNGLRLSAGEALNVLLS